MISILVPSRGRPDRFREMATSAFATAERDIEIVCRLDDDDSAIDEYPTDLNIAYITGARPPMMSALWNECWERATGDVGMLAGDDIIFETYGWDTKVYEAMNLARDRLVMVYTNDHTPRRAPVLPFISRRWADLVGFTTNDFPGWFADEWIWAMAAEIGRVVYLDDVTVRHDQRGDDATYLEAANKRQIEGGIDGLRQRFYSRDLVLQRDGLIRVLREAMTDSINLEPVPRPEWFQQSLDWDAENRPRTVEGRNSMLVVIHCWRGDADLVRQWMPLHRRHGRPVLVLSPEDAEVPGWAADDVTFHALGQRGYYGQESLDRERLHLEYLLAQPYDYFLLNDADSICLAPELPEYLFMPENRETVWSNEVSEWRPHASPYPKIAMQPPYFMHRDAMAKILTVADAPEVQAHPITPYIDWYMVALCEESGTEHRTFPDGASFPAWRRNGIEETQQLGHDFKHEYQEEGVIPGDAYMRQRVADGAIFLHSIKHPEVMDSLVELYDRSHGRETHVSGRKHSVSILVPFRPEPDDDTRTRIWEWIERRWRALIPDAEIIEGHDDGDEPFSKTTAVNDAYLHCTGDILIITDADTWLEADRIQKSIEATAVRKRLVVPWARVIRVDKPGSEALMAMDPSKPLPVETVSAERGSPDPTTAGTIVCITRNGFEKVNGMDPRMKGWGFEDISFRRACDVLLGETTYLHYGIAYSLWHEAPGNGDRGRIWGPNDLGMMNVELNNQYMEAESLPPGAMRDLCDEHPLGQKARPITPRYMRPIQQRRETGEWVDRVTMDEDQTEQPGELVARETMYEIN